MGLIEKIKAYVDLFLSAELHAISLVALGCLLTIKGHKDEAMLVLGGGLGILKGKS